MESTKGISNIPAATLYFHDIFIASLYLARSRNYPGTGIIKNQYPVKKIFTGIPNAVCGLAETYRSRTYRRPFDRPLVLKTRRHTGDETPPHSFFEIYT